MNDRIEIIEKIIQDKTFEKLSPEELNMLAGFGIDESQFKILKSLDEGMMRQGIEETGNIIDSPQTLRFLKSKLREKRKMSKPSFNEKVMSVIGYKIPVYQPLLLIIFLTLFYFIYKPIQYIPPEKTAGKEMIYRTDTVYQTLVPDTVKIVKVVYRTRYLKHESRVESEEENITFSRERYNMINAIYPARIGLTYDENQTIPEFIVSDK